MNEFENPDDSIREQIEETVNIANDLTFLKNTKGWQIVLNSFEQIENDALEQLGKQMPGDDKSILAAFSVWYSVKNTFKNVKEAVDSAIIDGEIARQASDTKPKDDWF